MKTTITLFALGCFLSSVQAQVLNPDSVKITLDEALPLAMAKAEKTFPELDDYILYSASPRVFKGDKKGLHWQFTWQEKAFPYDKYLVVRVYIKDRSLKSERGEKGTWDKEHDKVLEP